jgi:hypothetical protein
MTRGSGQSMNRLHGQHRFALPSPRLIRPDEAGPPRLTLSLHGSQEDMRVADEVDSTDATVDSKTMGGDNRRLS